MNLKQLDHSLAYVIFILIEAPKLPIHGGVVFLFSRLVIFRLRLPLDFGEHREGYEHRYALPDLVMVASFRNNFSLNQFGRTRRASIRDRQGRMAYRTYVHLQQLSVHLSPFVRNSLPDHLEEAETIHMF